MTHGLPFHRRAGRTLSTDLCNYGGVLIRELQMLKNRVNLFEKRRSLISTFKLAALKHFILFILLFQTNTFRSYML